MIAVRDLCLKYNLFAMGTKMSYSTNRPLPSMIDQQGNGRGCLQTRRQERPSVGVWSWRRDTDARNEAPRLSRIKRVTEHVKGNLRDVFVVVFGDLHEVVLRWSRFPNIYYTVYIYTTIVIWPNAFSRQLSS